MTNGELFTRENPDIEVKINGSCMWIYFDGVNHYTMPISWWGQEISLFDKIRAKIRKKMKFNCFNESYVLYDDISKIFDKYRAESEVEE